MDNEKWLELWILDELTCLAKRLSGFMEMPKCQSNSPWAFPTVIAIEADIEQRLRAVAECLRNKWIAVHSSAWLNSNSLRFGKDEESENYDPGNIDWDYQDRFVVTITDEGHRHWEKEFVPDWSRFWRYEFLCKRNENSTKKELILHYDNVRILARVRQQWRFQFTNVDDDEGARHC